MMPSISRTMSFSLGCLVEAQHIGEARASAAFHAETQPMRFGNRVLRHQLPDLRRRLCGEMISSFRTGLAICRLSVMDVPLLLSTFQLLVLLQNPSSSLAASLIILGFHGGSQTTFTGRRAPRDRPAFVSTSLGSDCAAGQWGEVRVIVTSTPALCRPPSPRR